jgi:hypothetical protein
MEARAPTPCAHCGRPTVTTDGVCRDCWRWKGDDGTRARRRPAPRTWPILPEGGWLRMLFDRLLPPWS